MSERAAPLPSSTDSRLPAARAAAARHRLIEGAVALGGVAAGVAFAEPAIAAVSAAWQRFVLPAYTTLIENGVFAWCM